MKDFLLINAEIFLEWSLVVTWWYLYDALKSFRTYGLVYLKEDLDNAS